MQDDFEYMWKPDGTHPKAKYVIFSPYRCKVTFPDGQWGIFGRGGGLDAIKAVQTFEDYTDGPCVIVGNFCEFAAKTTLLTGGEHYNNRVFNMAFRQFPLAKKKTKEAGQEYIPCFSRGQVTIGSNVVVSHGATVRSGVTIGDGAVIGAGSVVTKDVPPYAIVAGNPGRVIRYRVEERDIEDLLRIAWWNWDHGFLAQHMAAIHMLMPAEFIEYCADLRPPLPQNEDAAILFRIDERGEKGSLIFTGAEINGRLIPELPATFVEYIQQMNTPLSHPVTVCHNLFSRCGLSLAQV